MSALQEQKLNDLIRVKEHMSLIRKALSETIACSPKVRKDHGSHEFMKAAREYINILEAEKIDLQSQLYVIGVE